MNMFASSPLPDRLARQVRRLHFIEAESETVRQYFEALETDDAHEETLRRLPQLPELLDGYLKLMFEEADGIRLALHLELPDGERA